MSTCETTKSSQGSEMYAITENGGRFDVILPGAYVIGAERTVGTRIETFDSQTDAEAAVLDAKERAQVHAELTSLSKGFNSFSRIDEQGDGTFIVTMPGLANWDRSSYIGRYRKECATWEEAKREYLEEQRNRNERLSKKPILELQLSQQDTVAFSDFAAYNPSSAPSNESHPVHPALRQYFLQKEDPGHNDSGMSTYQETVKSPDWHIQLFDFVQNYLQREGKALVESIDIRDMRLLTPKQAINLSTAIVVELTKYNHKQTRSKPGEPTASDQSTVLDLLQEGLAHRDDTAWEGNGVCRNFACMVKAVFESIKAAQTKFNYLTNTYCLYEANNNSFKPKRKQRGVTSIGDFAGHAWNPFITVTKKGAEATYTDVTWAKQNLETKQVERIDYTLTRMEPAVKGIVTGLPREAPDREGQIDRTLLYFTLNAEQPRYAGGFSSADEQRWFFVSEAVSVIAKTEHFRPIDPKLVDIIGREYSKHAADIDPGELTTLWRLSRVNSNLSIASLINGYANVVQLSEHNKSWLLFPDDGLQSAVFDAIKTRPEFGKLMTESPSFRMRMRKIYPGLFPDGFSPGTNPVDAQELLELINKTTSLLDRNSYAYLIDHRAPNPEKVERALMTIRHELQDVNPGRYSAIAANLSDYDIISRFDELKSQIKG